MITVSGFSTHKEDMVRALLNEAPIKTFAIFQPASFIVIPPPPASVVVHMRDAIVLRSLAGELLFGGEVCEVDDDYFDWHAPDAEGDYEKLEEALTTYIRAHTADLKRQASRASVMRRLNARMKNLPRVVPNTNFVDAPEPFAFLDMWCDADQGGDDYAIRLWHENGGFEGRGFVDLGGYDNLGAHAQIEELDGNAGALAKWLFDNSPVSQAREAA